MRIAQLVLLLTLAIASITHATVAPNPVLFDGGTGAAGTLYVEPTGGSTVSTTCPIGDPCTPARAEDLALPGQKIIYTCGNYTNLKLTTARSGTPGAHIIYQSQTPHCAIFNASYNHLVVISHSYLTFDGIKFEDTKTGFPTATEGGSTLSIMRFDPSTNNSHIIIENCWFYHAGNYAIYGLGTPSGSNNIIIRNNKFEGTGYIADHSGEVMLFGTTSTVAPGIQNVFIYGNEIFDFTGNVLDARVSATGIWFYNNVMYDYDTPASHSMTTANAARDGLIRLEGAALYAYSNHFRDAPSAPVLGIGMRKGRTATEPNLAYNNILDTTTTQDPIFCISGNTGGAISSYFNNTHWALSDYDYDTAGCSDTTVRNNLGIQVVTNNLTNTSYDTTYFTDATGGDFTLTALATAAIDAATGAPFSETDFDGASVQGVARDYGAFESGETAPPPPPPSTTFPTTSIIDNFNRANVNPIGSPWVNGISSVGTCQITTNSLRASTGVDECYYDVAFETTQEVYITLTNATSHGDGDNVRIYGCLKDGIGTAATVDGYSVRFTKSTALTDTIRIERMTNGSYTTLATLSLEILTGYKIGMQILSTGVINMWADLGAGWVQQTTATDTTHNCAATRIGLGPLNSNHHMDDFGGGTQVSGGGSSNPLLAVPIFYE